MLGVDATHSAVACFHRYMLKLRSVDEFRALEGQELGSSSWHHVTQEKIAAFASATDDFEDLHLTPERGVEAGFGGTIAHGLYTLSLGPKFMYEIYSMSGHSLALNYGFEKVRFLTPVPVNSQVRMTLSLLEVSPLEGGSRFTMSQVFEIEGIEKPACVAHSIAAYFD